MKRLKVLAAVLCAALLAFGAAAFAACGEESAKALSGSMTVVVCDQTDENAEAKVYTVDLSNFTEKDSAEAVINYLVDKDDFYYEGYRGAYGLFFTAAGYRYTPEGSSYETNAYVVRQDASAGKYLFVYSSVKQDQETASYASTVDYEGTTLTSTKVGISFMHIEDGAIIYIGAILYNY